MKSEIELYTARKVKERRLKLKISQRYLADCLNINQRYISKIENPKYPEAYNVDHLNDIAVILECSTRDFFPEKPFRNNKKQ